MAAGETESASTVFADIRPHHSLWLALVGLDVLVRSFGPYVRTIAHLVAGGGDEDRGNLTYAIFA